MQITPDDLRSAAGRHLADATRHLEKGNLAQAAHLVGFAPECARKASLRPSWHKRLGHRMSGPVIDAIEALDPASACVGAIDALRGWTPEVRYQGDDRFDGVEVRALLGAATAATRAALARAWLTGRDRR